MSRRHWYMGGGLLLGAALSILAFNWPHSRPMAHQPAPERPKPVTKSADRPAESPLPAYAWHGSAADPKYIRLPTIGSEGFVQFMGVDQHHQVAAPDNIYLAGWYVNSVRPGEVGLSIIDGHVDGYQKPGLFKRLAQLKPGDQFSIERGDGRRLNYRVRHLATLTTGAAAEALFAHDPAISSQLNLITCAGTLTHAGGYDQRVVVTSEPDKMLP